MMFPRCFFLLSLIAAYRTADASYVNKDLEENLRPTKAQLYPSFCNGLECPKYRLVKKYSGFEHRQYEATQWISTEVPLSPDEPFTGDMDIRQYMDGTNSEGLYMEDTVPLVTMLTLENNKPVKMTLSVFLSANLKKPPKPLTSTIFLQKYPEVSLYVKSFGGIASDKDNIKQINTLATELIVLGLPFDESISAYNIYDPPDKSGDCYNEVWLFAV
ncbi:heme-binding protein 2-like [Dendropsophus ebraccatus]|uniref:heme-binding protein 2-like n=1 Tax=Dendropsophus ebraccatus TaxID=150705 RepID=UPI003831B574